MKYNRNFLLSASVMLTILLCTACSGRGEDDPIDVPNQGGTGVVVSLSNPIVEDITYNSAVVTSTITGATSIIKKGICYSTTNNNPTLQDQTVDMNSAGTKIELTLNGLEVQTCGTIPGHLSSHSSNQLLQMKPMHLSYRSRVP